MKYWQKVRVISWFYEGMEGILYREYTIHDWTLSWEPVNRRKTYSLKVENEVFPEMFELLDLEIIK